KMTGLVLMVGSVLLVFLFAPSDLKGRTSSSDRGLQIMKMAGLLLVCSNLAFQSSLLALSLFSVGLTLIPWKGGTKHALTPVLSVRHMPWRRCDHVCHHSLLGF